MFILIHEKSLTRAQSRYGKHLYAYRKVADRKAAELNAKRKNDSLGRVVVMTEDEFSKAIEGKGEWRTSVVGGQKVWVAHDTPACCDPSSEAYWSM